MRADTTTGAPAHFARKPDPRPAHTVGDEPDRLEPRLAWAALAIALGLLVVVAAQAIAGDWVPAGDGALVAIRTRDVFSGELPLTGSPAPALGPAGADHPAPLLYDALAVPVALFPGGTGLVLGVVAIDAAALVAMFLAARRQGGPLLAGAAMVEAAALCWAMGREALVEPSPASVVLLPFLAFLLLVWAVACGDVAMLPWAAAAGSFVAGTNLSYVVLVPGLLGFALGAAYLTRQRVPEAARGHPRAPWRVPTGWLPLRTALATVVVLAVAWTQPLYEELFGTGHGNLRRLGSAVRHLGDVTLLGWTATPQVVAEVLAMPVWWLPPSYGEALGLGPFGNPAESLLAVAAGLAGLSGQLAFLLRVSLQQTRDRVAASALVTALVVVVAALATAKLTPTVADYGAPVARLRWLWPVGVFLAFALFGTGLRHVVSLRPGWRKLLVLWLAAATLWMAGLTLLDLHVPVDGSRVPEEALPVARDLQREVAAADLTGPLLVECEETVADPYCEVVMAALQRAGVAFVVPDGVAGLGEGRRWDGDNAEQRLTVVTGDAGVLPRPGAEQLVLLDGLRPAQQRELAEAKDEVRDAAGDGRLELNEDGRDVAERGELPSVVPGPGGGSPRIAVDGALAERPHGRGLVFGEHRRELVAMVREELLDVTGELAGQLERYADLQEAWDQRTVALFVEPI